MKARWAWLGLVVALAGCSPSDDRVGPRPSHAPVDPMVRISQPDGDDAIPDADPLVHDRGTGPVSVPVRIPRGFDAIRVFVSCVPEAHYKVTAGKWFAGGCGREFLNSGQLDRAALGDARELRLEIPRGTRRWLVVVPVHKND